MHVMEASTDLFGGQTVKILRTLTQIQQLAVLAFVSLLRTGRGGDRITLSDLYASFTSLTRQWNLDKSFACDKSEFLSLCENALEAQRVVSLGTSLGAGKPSSPHPHLILILILIILTSSSPHPHLILTILNLILSTVGGKKAKGKTRNPLAAKKTKRPSGGGSGGDSRLVTLSMKEADIIKALATHKPIYVSSALR